MEWSVPTEIECLSWYGPTGMELQRLAARISRNKIVLGPIRNLIDHRIHNISTAVTTEESPDRSLGGNSSGYLTGRIPRKAVQLLTEYRFTQITLMRKEPHWSQVATELNLPQRELQNHYLRASTMPLPCS